MSASLQVAGRELTVSGRWLRKATLWDEAWLEETLPDPEAFLRKLDGVPADLFSFFLPLPESQHRFPLAHDWENVAAVIITSYKDWWDGLPQETRKNVRRAERRGLVVRPSRFDDQLVAGISEIYNETPLRQGRRFWHYRKPLEQVRMENSTYADRAEWIVAHQGEELIGFLKFVMVNRVARIMQILSKEAHHDKRPTNALLARAIEVAAGKGATHFIYGEYVYGTKENSPMTEFKRRNGFVRLNYPRYYVPLNRRGRLALKTGFHLPPLRLVPEAMVSTYLKVRAAYYRRTFRRPDASSKPAGSTNQGDADNPLAV